jgi:glycosyltransferase involved in cell wall biosynthesis
MHFPWTLDPDTRHKNHLGTLRPHIRDVLGVPYSLSSKSLERVNEKLILANSLFTARAIMRSLGLNAKVLYPPIPNSFFNNLNRNFESPRQNIVVTVARFGPDKGMELVPEIASLTDREIRYVMIGLAHDPQIIQGVKEKIKRLHVENRVKILLNAPRNEIKTYLGMAKVYFHTMKFEHFGISIAEAMAMGCTPVVHNSGGAPEFVPSKYRYNSLEEAATIVEKSMQNWTPQEACRLANISERFSQANYSKRFIELFSEFCSTKRK